MPDQPSPFRLTRLRIKNFRSIGEVDIHLGPLTVLIGPNGSGKSNVVDALRFMRDCFTRGLDQAILDREGMTVLRRWTGGGRPVDISLGITVADDEQSTITYDFILSAHAQRGFSIKREELCLTLVKENPIVIIQQGNDLTLIKNGKKQTKKIEFLGESGAKGRLRGPGAMVFLSERFEKPATARPDTFLSFLYKYDRYGWALQQLIEGALFYTLNPVQLRAPQRLVQETPFDEDGQNLSAVLQYLRQSKRTTEEIRQLLIRLVDGIVDFSVETTGSYLVTYLHYKNAAGDVRRADLGQESDGTLRILGILAALYQRKIPISQLPIQQFLTIEEPEVNIHPGMLAVLAELFQETSLRSQILLTTHSPDLLDSLPPESFLIVEKVDGETKVGSLANDQVQIIRDRLFSSGELLRMEGLHRQTEPTTPTAPQSA